MRLRAITNRRARNSLRGAITNRGIPIQREVGFIRSGLRTGRARRSALFSSPVACDYLAFPLNGRARGHTRSGVTTYPATDTGNVRGIGVAAEPSEYLARSTRLTAVSALVHPSTERRRERVWRAEEERKIRRARIGTEAITRRRR